MSADGVVAQLAKNTAKIIVVVTPRIFEILINIPMNNDFTVKT